MEKWLQALRDAGVRLEENCPLSAHSTFRIGGRARVALFPKNRQELLRALEVLSDVKLPMILIGKGSNVVFSDNGFDGAVVFTGGWQEIQRQDGRLWVSAGTSLTALANAACEASLGGAEFAYGIPGTLGGAVFMNAGAFDGCMEQICISSEYFDSLDGTVRERLGEAQAFGQRTSFYQQHPHMVIIGATLELHPSSKEEIRARMENYMERRRSTQPLEYPSAGSVFKRPEGHYAGKLIEDCGLKGYAVGGAQVSTKHAGFIVNRGGATAKDVKELTEYVQRQVWERFGVRLECEIRFLSDREDE